MFMLKSSLHALAVALVLAPIVAGGAEKSEPRAVYIATVHIDGNANAKGDASHPPESPPKSVLPVGGGISRGEPDQNGAWRMRMFTFVPAEVVAHEGETLRLHFVGVQGPKHRIRIDGQAEIIELTRGEVETVDWTAVKPGRYSFVSLGREPSMSGSILVLSKR
jgi:hypothetical protein